MITVGMPFNVVIVGDAVGEVICGLDGPDWLRGGSGADEPDSLMGEAGADFESGRILLPQIQQVGSLSTVGVSPEPLLISGGRSQPANPQE